MNHSNDILPTISIPDLIGLQGLETARVLFAMGGEKRLLSTAQIATLRPTLPILLASAQFELGLMNPALFPYLNDIKRAAIKNQLLRIYHVLYAQHQLDTAESRGHTLSALNQDIKKCSELLKQLDASTQPVTPEKLLQAEIDSREKALKYWGLVIADYIVKKIMGFLNHMTGSVKDTLTDINGVRLYWVWGGGMLSAVLGALPTDFFNVPQARHGVAAPSPITGYMSWLLYYTRFGINLGLLLKHTIKGPWMDAEESKIPMWDRFTTQWQQRKFILLNDSIWGLINMACFFWLRGSGVLGYVGNIVTLGLLLMDLSLTVWRFCEERTAHNKRMFDLNKGQDILKERLIIEEALQGDDRDLATIIDLRNQIATNNKLLRKTEFDWKHKQRGIITDLVYAAALLSGFALMCCFFFPPAFIAPATLMIFGLIGASLCFTLNAVYAAVSGGLGIAKTKDIQSNHLVEAKALFKEFRQTNDEKTRKGLYLEIKGLLAESDYQRRMVNFQRIQLIRSVFIDAFVPVIIFVALVFMPLGIGLGVLAAGLALAIFSKILLNQFAPKAAVLPEFDDAQFNEFVNKTPALLIDKEKLPNNLGFFAKNAQLAAEADEDSPDDMPEHIVKG